METKRYSFFDNLKFYIKQINIYEKKIYLLIFISVITSTALELVAVFIPALIIGLLQTQMNLDFIYYALFGFMCVNALLYFANMMNDSILYPSRISLRIDHFITSAYDKLLKMDYAHVEDPNKKLTYQKAQDNALESNDSGIENYPRSFTVFLNASLRMIVFLFTISIFSGWMVVAILSVSLISAIGIKYIRDYRLRNKLYWSKLRMESRYLTNTSIELEYGKDIRLYNLQDWLIKRTNDNLDEYLHEMKKLKYRELAISLLEKVMIFVRDFFCYIFLIKTTLEGMDVAQFTLYFSIMSLFSTITKEMVDELGKLIQSHQEINDYREFIDIEDISKGDIELKDVSDITIEFENVGYRYIGASKNTITNLSFTLNAKEKLALVGVNGAGKTTIVKLMCGLLRPTEGRILINGVDINTIDKEFYYSLIAPVFQDCKVIALSLWENISFSESLEEDRIVDVLTKAGVYEKVQTLDNMLEQQMTKAVYDKGIELSGGETQKLMLARALYKNAKLLILDEPTAALDALAESELYEKYAELIKDKSSLFISHRLSSTRFCDRIILLEYGKIIESGTHDELMKLDGKYANMFEVQSQYYKEENV